MGNKMFYINHGKNVYLWECCATSINYFIEKNTLSEIYYKKSQKFQMQKKTNSMEYWMKNVCNLFPATNLKFTSAAINDKSV